MDGMGQGRGVSEESEQGPNVICGGHLRTDLPGERLALGSFHRFWSIAGPVSVVTVGLGRRWDGSPTPQNSQYL